MKASRFFAMLYDAAMAAISFVLALWLRLWPEQWDLARPYLIYGAWLFTLVCITVFAAMRIYRGLWRYSSMQDMARLVRAATLSVMVFALLMFFINHLENVPRSFFFINWMLLLVLLGAPRFAYRALCDGALPRRSATPSIAKIPVLLIGAGNHAEQFIRDVERGRQSPYKVVALADGRMPKGRTIRGVPILGGPDALPAIVRRLELRGSRPQKLILTDDQAGGETVQQLLKIADRIGIPLARLPSLSALKSGISDRLEVRPIAVEDLLQRPQNVQNREAMWALVEDKTVLITGAGGTIGGELTRQVAGFDPARLILFENSEFNLYQIEREIAAAHPELSLTVVIGDVRDLKHVDEVFSTYKPGLVFHAAAIKHVPMAEANIEEAILTNVFGTKNIAESCRKHGAGVMVMISTDKAVNPTNVMGATKRLAENFCQALGEDRQGGTKFITVRFGNVLGSTGSVVPLFKEQLARGGPITVTHPEMTRYFMTVREAVELVMQAAALGVSMEGRRECVFVLDMGQPVKIVDLATQMIKLAGLTPEVDIRIVFTGLRPGEKLYEELFHFSENAAKTDCAGIFLAAPRFTELPALKRALESLFAAAAERNTEAALEMLKKLVPEFAHSPQYRQYQKVAGP